MIDVAVVLFMKNTNPGVEHVYTEYGVVPKYWMGFHSSAKHAKTRQCIESLISPSDGRRVGPEDYEMS